MGVVYEAKHKLIGKHVAIKVLSSLAYNEAPHQEIVQRLFNEAKVVNQIKHENIIDIFDFGTEGEHPYFVMELLEGRSLVDEIQGGMPLETNKALSIVKQVLSALEASHKAGVIHRDLKPENIFLIQRGKEPNFVKLLDFGIAKVRDLSVTGAGIILGTPAYMSPEQISAEVEIDHRTDLYSLGVLLFELFTGQIPYSIESPELLLVKRMTEPAPSPCVYNPDVPPAIEKIIGRALERDPNVRFQTASEFLAALGTVEEAIAQDAHPTPPQFPRVDPRKEQATVALSRPIGQLPSKSSRKLLGLCIVASLCVLGAGALFLRPSEEAKEVVASSLPSKEPTAKNIKPASQPKVVVTPRPVSLPSATAPIDPKDKPRKPLKPLFPTKKPK
jgi:serine/threonine protein kinase